MGADMPGRRPITDGEDEHGLWQRGEYALALAKNAFIEFAYDDHALTDAEREEAARLREQWDAAAQRKGRR